MLSITEANKLFKEKKMSSSELTKQCLERAVKSECNSYISITEDLALERARASDLRMAKGRRIGPLDGVPFSLKDLFITKGIRTTAGSRYLANYIPPYEGYISKALNQAGAVLVGKVGCDEFGMGSTNENTPFGEVLNPCDKNYVAGGSSGGSAASIVEQSALFSMGTDTGGSVRQPANFCGVAGLKPTYGRVSRFGQIAYASSLDQASPMAINTLDLCHIMDHITTKDLKDATNIATHSMNSYEHVNQVDAHYLKGKKIAFVEELIDGCSEDVRKNLRKSLDKFQAAGAQMLPVTLEHVRYSVACYYIIATSEASSNLARYDGIHYGHRAQGKLVKDLEQIYVESRTQGLGSEVKNRILLGTFSLSAGYQDQYYSQACKVRSLIRDDFKKVLKDASAIFFPVCASTAHQRGSVSDDPLKMYISDASTIPANLAGLPALALPDGKASNGLPCGFQLIGETFAEEELLKIGRAFELI